MDLVVKRVVLGEGQRMYGIGRVLERDGAKVIASELLYFQTGEPWAFTSPYWAGKKRRAFETESVESLRRAGIDVPEPANAAAEPSLDTEVGEQSLE